MRAQLRGNPSGALVVCRSFAFCNTTAQFGATLHPSDAASAHATSHMVATRPSLTAASGKGGEVESTTVAGGGATASVASGPGVRGEGGGHAKRRAPPAIPPMSNPAAKIFMPSSLSTQSDRSPIEATPRRPRNSQRRRSYRPSCCARRTRTTPSWGSAGTHRW